MAFGENKKCETCGEGGVVGKHWCATAFEVEIEYYDTRLTVHAFDASEAAEKAVARWERESADYLVIGGQEVTVAVTDADGEISRFDVTGQSVPQYTACHA